MADFSLTEDQEAALAGLSGFIASNQPFMVLEGFSGTGKSTLMQFFLKQLTSILKTRKLLHPRSPDYMDVQLTATTNKAAESLSTATGQDVRTVYSMLKLRVQTDFRTGKNNIQGDKHTPICDTLLIVDEASYVDSDLLKILETRVKAGSNSAVLFIGDPAQLVPVKYREAPVFARGYPTVKLTQVVRQAEGNPIIQLSALFRDALTTGQFGKFVPDQNKVQTLTHEEAGPRMIESFKDLDKDIRVLAWRNKTVVDYNNMIRGNLHGSTHFKVNDFATVNSYVHSEPPLKNDQSVRIISVVNNVERYGVKGTEYRLNHGIGVYFCPDDFREHSRLLKLARAESDSEMVNELMREWVDLRAPIAITINKSQGSTYDEVYVDLSDVGACNQGDTIARMLYVAVSRARDKVYLIGDIN